MGTGGGGTALRDDRGAAGVDLAGITMVVAAFVAAVVTGLALTAPDVLGRGVSASICRAWEKLPGVSTGECAILEPAAAPPAEDVPYEDRDWTYEEITSG